ncbi:MAG: EAL domain-containing protein [Candidatus Thiodiazotropha sp. 'RUGA']|nr:EAL domain-containing protein [Candidatus Thiodiazotropha sp. 'RUGA']
MTLRIKLLLPLLGFSALLASYILFGWLPEFTNRMEATERENTKAHLITVSEGLVPLLLEEQIANVYENLDALLKHTPNWKYLQLSSPDGLRIYPLSPVDNKALKSSDIEVISRPIGFLGPPLAYLELAYDLGPARQEIAELSHRLQIVFIALLVAFLGAIIVTLELLVSRPLSGVGKAADAVARGQFSSELPTFNDDEIGNLARRFHAMRKALQEHHKQLLNEISAHLETSEALAREKEQAAHQASHDPLTGLINRREFELRLEQSLTLATRESGQHALLYIDLDQFKVVNDTCGHIAGDALLQQLRKIMLDQIRQGDTLARLGGDEFGLLLMHCELPSAEKIANKLIGAIREYRFNWEEDSFTVGASIGLVAIDNHWNDKNQILSAADSACYMAKEAGRNQVRAYKESDQELVARKGEMMWISRLVTALQENHFILYGQRIHKINADNEASFKHIEALVRLQTNEGDIVPPGAFIPAAERFNLISQIDRWVFDKSIELLHDSAFDTPMELSINLSGVSISSPGFLLHVEQTIQEEGLNGHRICFEITESSAIRNLEAATNFIQRLTYLGCLFALDDFGSGMSSFQYLKALHVDYVKIDGAFVRDITLDPTDYAMVKAINDVATSMKLITIAEYVENEATLHALKEIGVDYAQGYYIGMPCPLDECL